MTNAEISKKIEGKTIVSMRTYDEWVIVKFTDGSELRISGSGEYGHESWLVDFEFQEEGL